MKRYQERKVIGRGNYGTAHLVKDILTGEKLVVKKIPLLSLTEKEKRDAASEVKLLSQLRHPNIVEYVDSFVEADTLHIVTQYCEIGDMSILIKQNKIRKIFFPERQIVDWFIQIVMAVDNIHSLNIMHRDLKTGNVFITKTNVVKLGDFGIAKVLDSTFEQAHTVVGTPYFMSPEVCENKQYDKRSDLWAMGCILYELCTLHHAFDASNLLGLVFKIVQEDYAPISSHYSKELQDLVRSLLSKDPAQRPSCRKIFRLPFVRQRLVELAKTSSLGSTPHPRNAISYDEDVPPPPPPPPSLLPPRSPSIGNCSPAHSVPRTDKVLGISKLQNTDCTSSQTPLNRIKEQKDASIRQREQALRQEAKSHLQKHLDAQKQSERNILPNTENSAMNIGPRSGSDMNRPESLRFMPNRATPKKDPHEMDETKITEETNKVVDTGEWNDSIQVGSARGSLTPISVPRPERRLRKARSSSGSYPNVTLGTKPRRQHTRCHSTNGSIFKTPDMDQLAVNMRPRSGSIQNLRSQGSPASSISARSPYQSSVAARSPFQSSPAHRLNGNRSALKVLDHSRIRRRLELVESSPNQNSAVAAAAAVHHATFNENFESPRPHRKSQRPREDIEDAKKVIDECKRRVCGNEVNSDDKVSPAKQSEKQGPDWQMIADKHRTRLSHLLGKSTFEQIYNYLSQVHVAGTKNSAKENQRELRRFVSKDKLDLAFEIDQLLFIEGVYCKQSKGSK